MSSLNTLLPAYRRALLTLAVTACSAMSAFASVTVIESVPDTAIPYKGDNAATDNTNLSFLPGEQFDSRTGIMGHYNTDLSVSGNGALGITINRRFSMNPDQPRAGDALYPDLFGSMALDIPRIEFTSFESVLHNDDDAATAATLPESGETWKKEARTLRCSGLHLFDKDLIYSNSNNGETNEIIRPGHHSQRVEQPYRHLTA